MASFGADVFADAGPDLLVVKTDADQLDVEGVSVRPGAQQNFEVLEGRHRTLGPLRGVDVHLLADLEQDREDELLLGLEVVVDEALGDARLLGDLFDRAVLVALAGEDAEGGLEDLVSGLG